MLGAPSVPWMKKQFSETYGHQVSVREVTTSHKEIITADCYPKIASCFKTAKTRKKKPGTDVHPLYNKKRDCF